MRFRHSFRKKAKLFANSGDPDQTPHSAASDLGLHCLPVTHFLVARLQWVNVLEYHNNPVLGQTVASDQGLHCLPLDQQYFKHINR